MCTHFTTSVMSVLSCRYVDPVMATGWHMLLGGMPLLALSIAREGPELGPRLQQLTGAYVMQIITFSAFKWLEATCRIHLACMSCNGSVIICRYTDVGSCLLAPKFGSDVLAAWQSVSLLIVHWNLKRSREMHHGF